jgi:V/A-type H+-transporting ATPase subunit I
MFKPQEMSKVIIAGTKDYMKAAIDVLHAHDVVHITEFAEESEDLKIGKPFPEATKLSEQAVSLRSIANYLNIKGKEGVSTKYTVASIEATFSEKIERLNFKVSQITHKISDLDSQIKDFTDKKKLLDPIKGFDIPVEMYRGYESIVVFVGLIKGQLSVDNITTDYYLESTLYSRGNVIALFVPKAFETEVFTALQEQNFTAISIPEMEGVPKKHISEFDAKVSELESEREIVEEDLKKIRQEYIDYVLASDEYLSIETQKAEAPLKFATTKNTFIVEGWIPTKRLERMQKDIDDATNGQVFLSIDKSEAVAIEKVPIALENPIQTRPYEVFIKAFSLPKFNEIDPTMLIFLWYPFFFGLMLGDIGYGIVVVAIAVIVRWKIKSRGLRALAGVGIYAGVVSIAFGFIYNEFFGVEVFGERGLLSFIHAYPTIPRFDNVLNLLIVTMVLGIIHLSLGYVVGFKNEYTQHGLKHAVYAKLSWLLILYGGVIAIVIILPQLTRGSGISLSSGLVAGLALAVIGVIFLVLGEGVIGIAELPSLLSNVLSYTRLVSIGVSSAGIALAVNKLSDALFISKGGFFLILGALMLIGGHAINTALGILDSGLQSLRLHYVEFFTKFYRGGGLKYKPFGYERKYTEEK